MISRKLTSLCFVASLAVVALVLGCTDTSTTDSGGSATKVSVNWDQSLFKVPEGSPAELLAYIEKLSKPEPFKSDEALQEYLAKISVSIIEAADRIMASPEVTDQQFVDAVEWKVEAYRVKTVLGDDNAPREADAFLAKLRSDPRPDVASKITDLWLFNRLQFLPAVDPSTRAEWINQVSQYLDTVDLKQFHGSLLVQIAETMEQLGDPQPAIRALDLLLPRFQKMPGDRMALLTETMEGLRNRLELPGNKMELEGTYLDGTPLDWEDYRGKVVLVDFWATNCVECRAELPNVLANYRDYRDKGFDVLGISLDTDQGLVEEFVESKQLPWRTLFSADNNNNGWEHPMAVRYGISAIPRAILVDQDGKVVSMNARGPMLRHELERLLGKPDASRDSKPDNKQASATSREDGPALLAR